MRPEQIQRLLDADPAALGARIRRHRLAAGLTQGALADGKVSVGYVSRIESGSRKPDSKLLSAFADRFGLSVEVLLDDDALGSPGSRESVVDEQTRSLELEVAYAELEAKSGDFDRAQTRVQPILRMDSGSVPVATRRRARMIDAGALESKGRLNDAILELEELVHESESDAPPLEVAIALSRCYRESGDVTRAIRACEPVLDHAERLGIDGTDEALQLSVTIAAAYFELGDTEHAIRQCRRALARADASGSARGQAAALWNASVMEAERGDKDVALELAAKALSILDVGDGSRNVARLRSQMGIMALRLDPPDVVAGREALETAAREMAASEVTLVDRVRNSLGLARVAYLEGSDSIALESIADVLGLLNDDAPQLRAEGALLRGQIWASRGQDDDARESFREAVQILTSVGDDRGAAQLWFDLASLLAESGDAQAASEAFRRAAASTGLVRRVASRLTT